MTLSSHIYSLCAVLLLGSCLGLRAEEFQMTKVHSMQEVKSLSAALVNGTPMQAGKIVKKPVLYAFYVAIGEPVPLSEDSRRKLAGDELAKSRVSEEDVMKMPMMEATQYYVLLDEKKKIVCLLAKHGGARISLSRVVESGADVFQNDPNGGIGSYYDFHFP